MPDELTSQEVFTILVPAGLKEQFRETCAQRGHTMSHVLRQAILQYLVQSGRPWDAR